MRSIVPNVGAYVTGACRSYRGRAVLGRTLLTQVKDARRNPDRPDGWQLVLLSQGEVPVLDILRLLYRAGYAGWISVEWEKRWHPEIEAPEVALPQYLSVLSTWLTGLKAGA